MTKRELIEALADVPDNARVFVHQSYDDAWLPFVKRYSSRKNGKTTDTVVLFATVGDHVSTDYLTEVK